MSFLVILLSILFTAFLGYVAIKGFNLIEDKLFAISCSYGLGIGLIYYQLFIYSRFGISWNRETIIIPWIIICFSIILFNKHRFKTSSFKIPKFEKFELLLLVSIAFLAIYTTFEAVVRPPVTWDSWATWLMESKAFFYDGKLILSTMDYFKSDYPLVLKLNWVFNYIFLGKENDTAVLLTSSAIYISLLIAFFSATRKKIGRKTALVFTFLLASVQVLIRQGGRMEAGQADLPFGYFAFISSVLLIEYLNKNKAKTFLLFNIFLAIVSLTKAEGLPFAMVCGLIGIYCIYKNKLYKHLFLSLFWVVPVLDWRLFRIQSNLPSYYLEGHPVEISIEKTKNAFLGTLGGFINIKSWGMLWIIYLYSVVVFGIKKNKELLILNILIISQILIYLGTYLFTFGNAPDSSIDRLLVHLAPIVIYVISFQYFYLKRKNKY